MYINVLLINKQPITVIVLTWNNVSCPSLLIQTLISVPLWQTPQQQSHTGDSPGSLRRPGKPQISVSRAPYVNVLSVEKCSQGSPGEEVVESFASSVWQTHASSAALRKLKHAHAQHTNTHAHTPTHTVNADTARRHNVCVSDKET